MKRAHCNSDRHYPYPKRRLLEKILKKNLGRLWNDVYSEICESADPRTNSGRLIRESLDYTVEKNISMIDGHPCTNISKYYQKEGTPLSPGEFYINPDTGILCMTAETKPNWKKNRTESKENRRIDPHNRLIQYFCIGGLWFCITLREATEEEKNYKCFGSFEKYNINLSRPTAWQKIWGNKIATELNESHSHAFPYGRFDDLWSLCYNLFGGNYFPMSKRQISTKEIRTIESWR